MIWKYSHLLYVYPPCSATIFYRLPLDHASASKDPPTDPHGWAHRLRRERVVRLAHVVGVRVQTIRWDGGGERSRMYAVEDQRKAYVCFCCGRQSLRVLSLIREHESTDQSNLCAREDRLFTPTSRKIVPATSCPLRISTSAAPSNGQEDKTRTRTRSSTPPPPHRNAEASGPALTHALLRRHRPCVHDARAARRTTSVSSPPADAADACEEDTRVRV
jgi:hypothetical protein